MRVSRERESERVSGERQRVSRESIERERERARERESERVSTASVERERERERESAREYRQRVSRE